MLPLSRGSGLKWGPTIFSWYRFLLLFICLAISFNWPSLLAQLDQRLPQDCALATHPVDAYQYGFFFPHFVRSYFHLRCLQQYQGTGKLATGTSHPFGAASPETCVVFSGRPIDPLPVVVRFVHLLSGQRRLWLLSSGCWENRLNRAKHTRSLIICSSYAFWDLDREALLA